MDKKILETAQDKITKEFCRFQIPITETTSIYNKQLNELFDYLWNLPNKERKNNIIFCIKDLYDYVKPVGDYFNVNVKTTNHLYDNTVILCVKKDFFNMNFYKGD